VEAGTTVLCVVSLATNSTNSGTCTLPASKLPASSTPYSVVATYAGDANFVNATSSAQGLTVVAQTTTTAVLVTTTTGAAVGKLTKVKLSATVSPTVEGSTPAPTGTVAMTATLASAPHTVYTLCT
jgi:hypothetical protein